jgi:hypothetical protein
MSNGRPLTKKIKSWVDAGLISPYQGESIDDFETKRHRVGRKSIRRTTWQLLILFLLFVGILMLMSSQWATWWLPVRLGTVFVGVGISQCFALFLLYDRLPSWIPRFTVNELNDVQRRDISAVLLSVSFIVGMFLIAYQYPLVMPLWRSLSCLVWLLLPLVVWFRSDWGSLFVGLISLLGALIAPAETVLFGLFPYWLMPLLWYFLPARFGWLQTGLYVLWVGCLATVLWPFCHPFWYLPMLGLFVYGGSSLLAGPVRLFLQRLGLSVSLIWAIFAMWWSVPIAWSTMFLMSGVLSLCLFWEIRQCCPLTRRAIQPFLWRPWVTVFLFLMWTVLLAYLQSLMPNGHHFLLFCHAVLCIALSMRLAWSSDRFLRGLGLSLLVMIGSVLLVQSFFPSWMRGLLMIGGGFGFWVFLRVRREGVLAPAPVVSEVPTQGPSSPYFSKIQSCFEPRSDCFKKMVLLFLIVQIVAISKPVLVYEWVRFFGESYLMKATVQDPYSPFQGSYLQFRMDDFETAWPVILPPGTKQTYLHLSEDGFVVTPIGLSPYKPEGLYLRIPVKWKSRVSTVTAAPFDKIVVSVSDMNTLRDVVKKNSSIWLYVKIKAGYCLLEGMKVGEKND